eukprot:2546927-Prymnesium_polylepis.1
MCSHLRAPRSRRWPLLSMWCTVHAAEGVDVLHPDHAPSPSKTDTHFSVSRHCIETCSCCGGGCRWGM